MIKYTSFYDRVFTCLCNSSLCLIRHFFLIRLRWRIRQISLYQQIFGTAIDFLVSAAIANMVTEDIKTLALNTYISGLKLWKWYVDDTFILTKIDMLTNFFIHINTVENSINFTMEKGNNGLITFLDTLITWLEHNQLSIKVYQKPTHTGEYLHFCSEHLLAHKCAVLHMLLQHADKLC